MNHAQTHPSTAHRDNLLGVCAAIGDATGINPLFPRLALVAAILAGAFEVTLLGYCLAAVAIAVARR